MNILKTWDTWDFEMSPYLPYPSSAPPAHANTLSTNFTFEYLFKIILKREGWEAPNGFLKYLFHCQQLQTLTFSPSLPAPPPPVRRDQWSSYDFKCLLPSLETRISKCSPHTNSTGFSWEMPPRKRHLFSVQILCLPQASRWIWNGGGGVGVTASVFWEALQMILMHTILGTTALNHSWPLGRKQEDCCPWVENLTLEPSC